MADLRIFPKPLKMEVKSGVYQFGSLSFSSDFAETGIAQKLISLGFSPAETPELRVVKNQSGSLPFSSPEGYILNVDSFGVEIIAGSAAGAYYGVCTLAQLLSSRIIRHCYIVDHPVLALRSFHLTFGSGFCPTFDYLKRMILELASLKINMMVWEYDDRFPWEKHPKLVNKHAFSKAQLRELIALAKDNFIEIMPLLDSLGHAEQYLMHPEYAHLKELPGRINEMCASSPATLKFVKELWSEVLELHADSRYAHITGDEVFRMGDFCPECAKRAQKGELAKLYLEYYTKLSRWMIKQGKTPVIWGDMLLKYPETIDDFPRDVVITEWCYLGSSAPSWRFRLMHKNPDGVTSKEREALLAPYWGKPGAYDPYPFVRFFSEKGFTVVGATASSLGGGYLVPQQQSRIDNQIGMALALRDNRALGLMNTYWSDSAPVGSAWAAIYASADFAWHPRNEDSGHFAREFETRFFGKNINLIPEADRLYHEYLSMQKMYPPQCVADLELPPGSFGSEYYQKLKLNIQLGNLDREILNFALSRYLSMPHASKIKQLCLLDSPCRVDEVFYGDAGALPLTRGEQKWGEYQFYADPDHVVSTRRELPEFEIKVDDYATNFDLLSFGYYIADGETAAYLDIYYEDERKCSVPLTGGVDVCDWWGNYRLGKNVIPYKMFLVEDTMSAWLYLSEIRNPEPTQKVRHIVVRNAGGSAVLALAAVNAVVRPGYTLKEMTSAQRQQLIAGLDENLQCQQQLFARYAAKDDVRHAISRMRAQRVGFIDVFCPAGA